MTTPFPSVSALAGLPAPASNATLTGVAIPAVTVSTAPVAPTQPAPAAAAAGSQTQWSAQALQNLRFQAFEQLIAQLSLQIQSASSTAPATWPTQGLPAATAQFMGQLLAQVHISAQGQPQALQLQAAQPGSTALMQALALTPGSASARQTATTLSATTAAAAAAAQQPSPQPHSGASRMLPLQNWWVQQGVIVTPQGERSFSAILQVPTAWAEAAGPAFASAPGRDLSAQPLRLPWPSSAPLPSTGAVALVLQAATAQPTPPTSALLWLEVPAMAGTSTPAAAMAAVNPVLAQEVQNLLQNKSDPWLQIAAMQAANALPLSRGHAGEHRSHLCTTSGCQYEGQAPCAQPFCSEMTRIWSSTPLSRSSGV